MKTNAGSHRPSRGIVATAAVGVLAIAVTCAYMLHGRRDLATVLSTGANLGVLLVAILALWFTAAQLFQAREANNLATAAQRSAAEQAEKDSKAQVRPYVYASLVPGLWGPSSCDLKIENFGKTPARNLLIHVGSWPDSSNRHLLKLKKFCEAPHTLPPGASHRLIWHDSRLTDQDEAFGQDETVDITLSYSDDNGDRWSEDYRCDVSLIQVEPAPSEGSESRGSGSEKVLENINNALRALNVHVGSMRR